MEVSVKDMQIKRVIWIVLDSVGMGELPDADKFDDVGTNTIGHVSEKHNGLKVPNMVKIGLGNINGIVGIDKCDNPIGCYGKMAEMSMVRTLQWAIGNGRNIFV